MSNCGGELIKKFNKIRDKFNKLINEINSLVEDNSDLESTIEDLREDIIKPINKITKIPISITLKEEIDGFYNEIKKKAGENTYDALINHLIGDNDKINDNLTYKQFIESLFEENGLKTFSDDVDGVYDSLKKIKEDLVIKNNEAQELALKNQEIAFLKEKIQLLETQIQHLKEINSLLKEKKG